MASGLCMLVVVPAHAAVKGAPAARSPWPGRIDLGVGLLLAIASALMHAAAWLWPGVWLPVWIAQAMLIGLAVACKPRYALALGTLSGALAIALSFYWGVEALRQAFGASLFLGVSVFSLLVAMEAAGMGVFCWITSLAVRRGVAWMWIVPCAWVAIEHWFPRVFPWKLGYSQLEVLPLIQIADVTGSAGISFVLMAVASIPALLTIAWWQTPRSVARWWAVFYSLSAAMLLLATLTYGSARMAQWSRADAELPKFQVGVIQIDPSYRGSEIQFRRRSLEIDQQVDLLCWPESALGSYSDELAHFRNPTETTRLSRQSLDYLEPAKDLACHLLAGGKQYRADAADNGPYWMTAYLISPAQDIVGRYRKRTLLPFGEYVPLQRYFPVLREWATLQEVFEAGDDAAPLVTVEGRRLGVVICYEDTLPKNARLTVAAGAEALFSLIQGNAFENRLTLVQHQRLAAMRAVENRRYFVRCSSTGVSCVIHPLGRVESQLPPQADGTLVSTISLVNFRTVYNRIGDVFPIACTLLTAVGLLYCFRHRGSCGTEPMPPAGGSRALSPQLG